MSALIIENPNRILTQGKFILSRKQALMLDFVALNPTYNSQNSAIDGIFVDFCSLG
jgi:hypothetical protein